MLYDDDINIGDPRRSDTELDPQQLLDDLIALVRAGLIVPTRDRDGQVRVTPAEPLAWERRSRS